jgi:O-antigen/teichoic acid export membrane protein
MNGPSSVPPSPMQEEREVAAVQVGSQASSGQGESLRNQVASGAAWSVISRFGQQIISTGCTVVVARLIPPSAYGIVGMAAMILAFTGMFRELGFTMALIREKSPSEKLLSTVFWANLILSTGLAILVSVLAGTLSTFYREPQVAPFIRALSISFVINGVSMVPAVLMARKLEFRRAAHFEIGAALIAAAVAIVMAVSGFGAWTLVGFSTVNAAVNALFIWRWTRWLPIFTWSWGELKGITGFSLNLTWFGIVNFAARNGDNVLVGRYLGAAPLGYYQFAYNLMLYPIYSVAGVFGRALFPGFSRLQDDNERFGNAYLRVCALLGLITFPIILGMIATAEPLVRVILGPQWLAVVPLLQILAPTGLIQSISTTVGHIYTVKGRTGVLFVWGILSTVIMLAGVAIGLRFGVTGVAVGYAIANLILAYPAFAIPFRFIGLSVWDLVTVLWPIAWMNLIMFGAAWGGVHVLRPHFAPWLVLLIIAGVAIAIYGGLLFWRKPPAFLELCDIIQEKIATSPALRDRLGKLRCALGNIG